MLSPSPQASAYPAECLPEILQKVEAGILSANKNFVIAKAGMDEATLNTALMAPKQEVNLVFVSSIRVGVICLDAIILPPYTLP